MTGFIFIIPLRLSKAVGLFLSHIMLFALAACLAINVLAQEPLAPKSSDVRLVIDISGSMKKK